MAFLDEGSGSTLEDVLGSQAQNASNDITNQFAKARKRAVGQQAHAGRLTSGVSNYNFGDLAAQEVGAQGGVQQGLAEALGQIPTNDYLGEQDFSRNRRLAELVASLQKPSTLEEVMGGIGAAGNLAATGAAFF